MSNTIRVEAVPGRLLMLERARGFVGMRRLSKSESAEGAHVAPDGFAWVASGPVEVVSSSYYRRAIARGDIKIAAEAPAPKVEKKEKK